MSGELEVRKDGDEEKDGDRPPPHPSAASIPSLLSSLTDPCSPQSQGVVSLPARLPDSPTSPPHPLRGDRLPIRNAAVATPASAPVSLKKNPLQLL
ncbi:hypothetical protein EYF80_000039 [Liparis tanakae]|uniref:Uncharacterized protein n=1 Tax=Liparis tanakae TaxID=230148 RepID=A0A4Z2JGM5_9TELE|nr:hypothetical protein EYF80_000039 [Liparis tanakae]